MKKIALFAAIAALASTPAEAGFVGWDGHNGPVRCMLETSHPNNLANLFRNFMPCLAGVFHA